MTMTVLVTRPSPVGEALTQQLNMQGIKALHTPLIRYSLGRELIQLPQWLKQLSEGDIIFAVSPSAVNYANHYLMEHAITWPVNKINYLAIGKSSAQLLEKAVNKPVLYPQSMEISEQLLTLPVLQNVKGKKALILRGNGGRDFLAQQLAQLGADVIFCECYQRIPINYCGEEIGKYWQQSGVNTLVVTSGEMLQQLFSLLPTNQHTWLLACHLVVVSERLAQLAQRLGWPIVTVAKKADNSTLLETLKTQI